MVAAISAATGKLLVTIEGGADKRYILERHKWGEDGHWLVYTGRGFEEKGCKARPLPVHSGDVLDTFNLEKTLHSYRIADAAIPHPTGDDWEYSNWVRNSAEDSIGYTFGNYSPAPGAWGTIVTPDDIRYTYIWGTDFKATNGASFFFSHQPSAVSLQLYGSARSFLCGLRAHRSCAAGSACLACKLIAGSRELAAESH